LARFGETGWVEGLTTLSGPQEDRENHAVTGRKFLLFSRRGAHALNFTKTDTVGEFCRVGRAPPGSYATIADLHSHYVSLVHTEESYVAAAPGGPPVPDETRRVARAAFPKNNVYIRMRDALGAIYQDHLFAPLFPTQGQPAASPWRLALTTIMQFAEGLSDRQAADAVRSRIDWKYALSLELTGPSFDFSVLSEFRARLIAGSLEQQLLYKPRVALSG
jgi:transposase